MTDATNLSRLGQVNNAGAVDATFLKLASGEVLAAFQQQQVTMGKFYERTIVNGKSATFPFTGRASAYYHTPGEFIDGNKIAQNEKVIPIDGKLLSDVQVSDIDELQNHYDVRAIFTSELGESIANIYDGNNLRCAILGARSTDEVVAGETATQALIDPDAGVEVVNLVEAIAAGNTAMTELRVPRTDRCTFVRPVQYALLTQSNIVTNRDLGGIGSFAQGVSGPVQGTGIVETINLPNTDESADASLAAKYRSDYSGVVALTTHKSAVGVVKLMQMATEIVWDPRRQVWLMIAKQATGHDFLRTSAAHVVQTA